MKELPAKELTADELQKLEDCINEIDSVLQRDGFWHFDTMALEAKFNEQKDKINRGEADRALVADAVGLLHEIKDKAEAEGRGSEALVQALDAADEELLPLTVVPAPADDSKEEADLRISGPTTPKPIAASTTPFTDADKKKAADAKEKAKEPPKPSPLRAFAWDKETHHQNYYNALGKFNDQFFNGDGTPKAEFHALSQTNQAEALTVQKAFNERKINTIQADMARMQQLAKDEANIKTEADRKKAEKDGATLDAFNQARAARDEIELKQMRETIATMKIVQADRNLWAKHPNVKKELEKETKTAEKESKGFEKTSEEFKKLRLAEPQRVEKVGGLMRGYVFIDHNDKSVYSDSEWIVSFPKVLNIMKAEGMVKDFDTIHIDPPEPQFTYDEWFSNPVSRITFHNYVRRVNQSLENNLEPVGGVDFVKKNMGKLNFWQKDRFAKALANFERNKAQANLGGGLKQAAGADKAAPAVQSLATPVRPDVPKVSTPRGGRSSGTSR